jgi:hypothetical protein
MEWLPEVLVTLLWNHIISSLCTVEVLLLTMFVLQNFPVLEKGKIGNRVATLS